jgi:hypothetical protein
MRKLPQPAECLWAMFIKTALAVVQSEPSMMELHSRGFLGLHPPDLVRRE